MHFGLILRSLFHPFVRIEGLELVDQLAVVIHVLLLAQEVVVICIVLLDVLGFDWLTNFSKCWNQAHLHLARLVKLEEDVDLREGRVADYREVALSGWDDAQHLIQRFVSECSRCELHVLTQTHMHFEIVASFVQHE